MPVILELRRNGEPVPTNWDFVAYVGATFATHVEALPEAMDATLREVPDLSFFGVKHTDAIGYQMRGIAPLPCTIKHKWAFTNAEAFDDDARTFVLLPGDEIISYRS